MVSMVPDMIGSDSTLTLYSYDRDSDSVDDATLNMRFPIAYAVNLQLRQAQPDGVLGLSLYQ